MTTRLIATDKGYYCANCRMKQQKLRETCYFCGRIFYNYEQVILKDYQYLVEAKLIDAIEETNSND